MLNKKLMFAILFAMMMTAGAAYAGGDAASGESLAEDCAGCHGDNGEGDEDSPPLAGLDEAYQIEQLKAFKSGERVDEGEMMGMYAEDLSEQDMADLAAFYASK